MARMPAAATPTADAHATADPIGEARSTGPRVRVLGADEVSEAAALLARGFEEEPGNRELFPDPNLRRQLAVLVFTRQLQATLPYATAFGAELDGRLGGAAIWHPPKVAPSSMRASVELARGLALQTPSLLRGLPAATSTVVRKGAAMPWVALQRQRAIAAAAAGPTWHLAFLATDPELRGRGLARCLLEHVLDRCDQDGLAAWLETTAPVNPPLYERFGYRTVSHIDRAGWMPGLWVMRREPSR